MLPTNSAIKKNSIFYRLYILYLCAADMNVAELTMATANFQHLPHAKKAQAAKRFVHRQMTSDNKLHK